MALTPIHMTCSTCKHQFKALPKRSFLGFQKVTCPACGQQSTHPLTSGYRTAYWVILILISLSLINTLAQGRFGFPGLVAFAMAFALYKDHSLRKQ